MASLELHQQRRAAGRPTISTMVGDLNRGLQVAQAWARERAWPLLCVRPKSEDSIVARLLAQVLAAPDTIEQVRKLAAEMLGMDLDVLVRGLQARDRDRTRLLEALRVAGRHGPACALVLGSQPPAPPQAHVLARLADFPNIRLPVLIALCTDAGACNRLLSEVLRILEAVPRLPVVVLLADDTWRELQRRMKGYRALDMLRDGLLRLAPQDRPAQPVGGAAAGNTPVTAAAGVAEFRDTAARALEAARRIADDQQAAAESQRARSAAEALLYTMLETSVETTGLFELNACCCAGERRLEIDLMSRDLKIAIEIDGYYHFLGPDQYRRDRSKDLLLQQAGFCVLRFLADDLTEHMTEVWKRVTEVVEWRRTMERTARA